MDLETPTQHKDIDELRLNTLFEDKQKTVFFNHFIAFIFMSEIYWINAQATIIWYSFFLVTVLFRHFAISNYHRQWFTKPPLSPENIYAVATSLNFLSWGLSYFFYRETSDPSSMHVIFVATYALLFGGLATNFSSLKTSYGILFLIISCIVYFEITMVDGNIRVVIGISAFSLILRKIIKIGHTATIRSLLLASETEKNLAIQNKNLVLEKELSQQRERDFQKDLEVTAAVQDLLFPISNQIQIQNWDIAGLCLSASICSGDWWWVKECPDGRILVFCADVTGHGASSALVTAILASSIRNFSDDDFNFSTVEIIEKTNKTVNDICKEEYFSTLNCIELLPDSHRAYCYFQGAPPIFHLSAHDKSWEIGAPSSLIGTSHKKHHLEKIELPFNLGDRIAIVSDGLIEAELSSGEEFGRRRLQKILVDSATMAANEAVQSVINTSNSILETDKYQDDVTIILVDHLSKKSTTQSKNQEMAM